MSNWFDDEKKETPGASVPESGEPLITPPPADSASAGDSGSGRRNNRRNPLRAPFPTGAGSVPTPPITGMRLPPPIRRSLLSLPLSLPTAAGTARPTRLPPPGSRGTAPPAPSRLRTAIPRRAIMLLTAPGMHPPRRIPPASRPRKSATSRTRSSRSWRWCAARRLSRSRCCWRFP